MSRPATGERRVAGIQPVRQLLLARAESIRRIWLQADIGRERLARLEPVLGNTKCEVLRCSAAELDALVQGVRHQGVVAEVHAISPLDDAQARALVERLDSPFLLLLDSVQDPHNMGACLRTAEAAGVDLVIAGRNRSVAVTPTVSRAAAGAAEIQPLARVANLARFMEFLRARGVRLVGADAGADRTLYDVDLTGPVGLVLGAEGSGLRALTRRHCDLLAGLPMAGTVGSLNVSVATGVCLYEALRQRRVAGIPGVR